MRRILAVDDEPACRELFRAVLEEAGYQVATAATVAEALGLTGPWDLLVLDRRLPDGDGRSIAAAWPGTPALFVSGLDDADLRKPFSWRALVAAVRRRLEEGPAA